MTEELFPVALVGCDKVGKRAFEHWFKNETFIDTQPNTSQQNLLFVSDVYDPDSIRRSHREIHVDGSLSRIYFLKVSDRQDNKSMADHKIKSSRGALIIYSVKDTQSFSQVEDFREQIVKVHQDERFPIILIGNQWESEEERSVPKAKGEEMAKAFSCPFYETSAKTGANIREAIEHLIRLIRQHQGSKTSEKQSSCCCNLL
jgi:GTPase SAR1 family protein